MRDSEPYDLDDIPRHQKRAVKSRGRFGIECYLGLFKKKWILLRWYKTEKRRDQALEDLIRHTCSVLKKPGHEARYRKKDR